MAGLITMLEGISSSLNPINSFMQLFGYKLCKIAGQKKISFPYIKTYKISGKDFLLWIPDQLSREWYDGETQDWDDIAEIKELMRITRPGDNVLEIGSHVGFFTLFLAQCIGSEGRICAVEASPFHALVCQAQVALNDLCGRVSAIPAAASNLSGKIHFSRDHIVFCNEPEKMRIDSVTGDDLSREFGPFTMLKIDVEGSEQIVLEGCSSILQQRPKLALEIHLDNLSRYRSSLSKIFERISIDSYSGTMMIRPDWKTVHEFHRDALPHNGVVNLFLEPKL